MMIHVFFVLLVGQLIGNPFVQSQSGPATTANTTSSDVDVCQNATLNNCPKDAKCNNTDSGYTCICSNGYVYNGTHCIDVDECQNDTLNNCPTESTCRNLDGRYTCICRDRYVYTGVDCIGPCGGDLGLITKNTSIEFPLDNKRYHSNMYCTWTFTTNGTSLLTFTRFYTERTHDWVEIKENDVTRIRSSGYGLPKDTFVSGNIAIIFQSDSSLNYRGFIMEIEASVEPPTKAPGGRCGEDLGLISGKTVIEYPTNGTHYSNMKECTWTFKTNGSGKFINFTRLDTEEYRDVVVIKENNVIRTRSSGSTLPTAIYVKGNITITFTSDYNVTMSGFRLEITETCELSNKGFGGYQITLFFNIATWAECWSLCQKDRRCIGWNYYSERYFSPAYKRICQPLYSILNTQNANGLIAGYKSCEPPVTPCGGDLGLIVNNTVIEFPIDNKRYLENMECTWTFTTNGTSFVTFTQFDTEATHDWVEIKENNVTPIRLSGHTLPKGTFVSGNISIIFKSDRSLSYGGFRMEIEASVEPPKKASGGPCGKDLGLISENTVIEYGLNGTHYPNMKECTWTFTTNGTKFIRYTRFETEQSRDVVEIKENNVIRTRSSGSGTPMSIFVKGNITITFTSDYNVTMSGFRLEITDFCGADLGLISEDTLIEYPSNGTYLSNMLCKWTFTTNERVTLRYTRFDTEDGYDYVNIYENDELRKDHSGSSDLPDSVAVSGNITVTFTSDASSNGRGFRMVIDVRSCGGDLGVISGKKVIEYPKNKTYPHWQECTWTFTSFGNTTLGYTRFDIERGYDFLKIFENGISRSIESGASIPDNITVSGNITVTFTSDSEDHGRGFRMVLEGPEMPSSTPAACGGDLGVISGKKVIEYPKNKTYPHWQECTWTFTTSGNTTLGYTRFDTESGYDKVKIFENGISRSIESGKSLPDNITVSGNITVTFTSDAHTHGRGFRMVIEGPEMPSTTPAVSSTGKPTSTPAASPTKKASSTVLVSSTEKPSSTVLVSSTEKPSSTVLDEAFTVSCPNNSIYGVWLKSQFPNGNISITLNEPKCNSFNGNATHIWVSIPFNECGSVRIITNTTIIYKNTVVILARSILQNVAERDLEYRYTMQCQMDRRMMVSTATYFNTSGVTTDGGTFNMTGDSLVDVSIDLFSSSSFQLPAETPVMVTSRQPMYIGIKQNDHKKNAKIIVTGCFATPTSKGEGASYTFFDKKCALDHTFKQLSHGPDHFNFQIDAFSFIEVRGAVYIHCHLYVCPANSSSTTCTQQCHLRHRRAAGDSETLLDELSVTSELIRFQRTKTCSDVTCPENAVCVDLYPAVCRCRPGYVFDPSTGVCRNENLLFIRGVHLDENFVPTYADETSLDFHRYAIKVERVINQLLTSRDERILGVQVVKMTKGSVVVDVLVTYLSSITSRDVYDIFVTTLMNENNQVSTLNIKRDRKPYVSVWTKPVKEEEALFLTHSNVLIIAVAVPSLLLLLTLAIIWKMLSKHRAVREQNAKGIDNNGLHFDISLGDIE